MDAKKIWSDEEIKQELESFSKLYQRREFRDNRGGMKSTHLFYFYFVLIKLKFENVIESGVWKGQGTWLMDQIESVKKIMSIDINPKFIKYKSKKASYFNKDFSTQNFILDREKTLCFFDDHQNAFQRLKTCKEKGYKYLIFEDNYPLTKGDCLSIKKIIDLYSNRNMNLSKSEHNGKYEPPINQIEEMYQFIKDNIKTYYEFPPIFCEGKSRWGTEWGKLVTKNPLYESVEKDYLKIYRLEHKDYTYIAYVELN